jgi:lipid-A-disaccharide synthase
MTRKYRIFICAGEPSGDNHGAKLVNALREAAPEVELDVFGAGGPKLREAGLDAVVRTDDMAIVGLPEIARALPMFIRVFGKLKRAAVQRKADLAVLIDYPDFNLRLARSLKKNGISVVYYISPQLWAWRKYRISTIRKYVDLLISILPFEKDWYAENGYSRVEYVGSPLVREIHAAKAKAKFCEIHGLDQFKPIISMLPGSRHRELERILPEMLRAAAIISAKKPETQFLVALAANRRVEEIERATAHLSSSEQLGLKGKLFRIEDATYDALAASDAAAVTSGTATLETGIIGTPMVIVYKTSKINYSLLRPLIDVTHFGLINLIAGERVGKELIQNDLTPEGLATELLRLLDPTENNRVRKSLKEAADKLGSGGASRRAAEAILRLL